MAETIEQRVIRLERVVGTLRSRLQVCRRKRDENRQQFDATTERLREARDSFRYERDRLRAHFDLTAEDGTHGRYAGCYILMKLGVAVYVGQSVNIFGRIASHRGARSFPTSGDFDEARVIWCAADELDATERRLIEELQPRFNNAGVTRPYMRAPRNRGRLPADLFGPVFLAVSEGAAA
jgi:hypothetical protein